MKMKQHFVDVTYLIIYNILQSYAKLIIKIIEKVLFVYKSNSTDLIHDSLCCGAFVGKVGSDSNGKFSSKLFPPFKYDYKLYNCNNCIIHLKPGTVTCFPSPPMRTSIPSIVTGWFSGLTATLHKSVSDSGSTISWNSTPPYTCTPKHRAVFSRIHCSLLIPGQWETLW